MDYSTKQILIWLNIIVPGLGTILTNPEDALLNRPKLKTYAIIQIVAYAGGFFISFIISILTLGICGTITILVPLGAWVWALIDTIYIFKIFSVQAQKEKAGGGQAPPDA